MSERIIDHPISSAGPVKTLIVLIAFTLFAFAGAYHWTTLPLLAGAMLLGAIVHPSIGRDSTRLLDFALAACLLVIAAQLVPLPSNLRQALSPRMNGVEELLWLAPRVAEASAPLSIDPNATRWSLALAVSLAMVFWSAREFLARGGARRTAAGIAWVGLALAAVALLQHATAPRKLYWIYPTIFGAPFGPYLNRNDFSTWLIMAVPVAMGAMQARIESRYRLHDGGFRLDAAKDAQLVALLASTCLMSAALLTSTSRSGLTAAAAATLCFIWFSWIRLGEQGRAPLLAAATAIIAVAAMYANLGALADRVGETLASGVGGRRVIWKETWPMVRDFWMTGVGVGAYERGMLVYQQTKGLFYFNHAHNEYLQLAAEGGALLCVPAGVMVLSGFRLIARRLSADQSPVFWIRAGAVTGMLAVSVQSVWDTGLRMPANSLLFASLAALALHQPAGSTRGGDDDRCQPTAVSAIEA
jgi:O-Antigen ligase